MNLAITNNVSINYEVCDVESLSCLSAGYDVVALIYAHFPGELKSAYHEKLIEQLKPGGIVILEAFSKNQIHYRHKYSSGGPGDLSMLFSTDEVKTDFFDFNIIMLIEEEIEFPQEGNYSGLGSVIRFVGVKN